MKRIALSALAAFLAIAIAAHAQENTSWGSIKTGQSEKGVVAKRANALVSQWKFNKGSGLIARDASRNRNHGTLVNGPIWSTDVPRPDDDDEGYSLFFDGADDYVSVPDAPSLEVSTMTLAAWVKAAVVSPEAVPRFLGKARIDGGSGYALGVNFGFPHLGLNDGLGNNCGVSAAEMLVAGQWTHVAGTYDASSGTMKIYVNGQLAGTGSCAITALQDSDEPLNIGREFAGALTGGDGRHFNGNLDDVRVYSTVLSASRIRALAAVDEDDDEDEDD
jgi:hypothetical protein